MTTTQHAPRRAARDRDLYQEVTDRIVAALEAGTVPWVRPWGGAEPGLPRNGATGRAYSGINVPLLWLTATEQGYASNEWYTYNQARLLGGQVREGEKATLITFWKDLEVKRAGPTGEQLTEKIPMLRHWTVFNRAQIDGLPPIEAANVILPEYERHRAAETVVERLGVPGTRAAYKQDVDAIRMPAINAFRSGEAYYGTLLHEAVHATGAPSRLHRPLDSQFGTPDYAREELVAEMGAAFACAELGIKGDLQHPEYLANWLKVLKEDKKAIFKAASQARQAVEFLQVREIALEAGALDESLASTVPEERSDPERLARLNPLQAMWALQSAEHDRAHAPIGADLVAHAAEPRPELGGSFAELLVGSNTERHQALGWLLADANRYAASTLPSGMPLAQREALVATQVSVACRTHEPAEVAAAVGESLTAACARARREFAQEVALTTERGGAPEREGASHPQHPAAPGEDFGWNR